MLRIIPQPSICQPLRPRASSYTPSRQLLFLKLHGISLGLQLQVDARPVYYISVEFVIELRMCNCRCVTYSSNVCKVFESVHISCPCDIMITSITRTKYQSTMAPKYLKYYMLKHQEDLVPLPDVLAESGHEKRILQGVVGASINPLVIAEGAPSPTCSECSSSPAFVATREYNYACT